MASRTSNRPNNNTAESRTAALQKKDLALAEEIRGHCPPARYNALPDLIKKYKGDRTLITNELLTWWEEPIVEEEVWVTKDNNKSKEVKQNTINNENTPRNSNFAAGGRGAGRGGRGEPSRGPAGGRGNGAESRPRRTPPQAFPAPKTADTEVATEVAVESPAPVVVAAAAPVVVAPVVDTKPVVSTPGAPTAKTGAWGKPAPPKAPAMIPAPVVNVPEPVVEKVVEKIAELVVVAPVVVEKVVEPVVVVEKVVEQPVVVVEAPKKAGGNVWATKGSAHLIEAEKPKPVVVAPVVAKENKAKKTRNNNKNTKNEESNSSTVEVSSQAQHVDAPAVEENVAVTVDVTTYEAANVVVEAPSSPERKPVETKEVEKSPKLLKMSRWEQTTANIESTDFNFGSFEGEVAVKVEEKVVVPVVAPVVVPASPEKKVAVSPARPPPGLSDFKGLPPMPANAVNVADLEVELTKPVAVAPVAVAPVAVAPVVAAPVEVVAPVAPAPVSTADFQQQNHQAMMAQNAFAYMYGMPGMNGMYAANNNNAAAIGSGLHMNLGGLHTNGMGSNHMQKDAVPVANSNNAGLYNSVSNTPAVAPAAPVVGLNNNMNNNAINANVPPGMPNMNNAAAMNPQFNPALYYQYQQQMTNQYGQYGNNPNYQGNNMYGAQQGQYGNMGFPMNQGYQPYEMDHNAHHNTQHGGGGYRGSNYRGKNHNNNNHHHQNSHHQNNHYNQQYQQPQYGGYGQPQMGGGYGMDPFGRGPANPMANNQGYGQPQMDPYANPAVGGYNAGFGAAGAEGSDDTEHHGAPKGAKKGGNRNQGYMGGNQGQGQYGIYNQGVQQVAPQAQQGNNYNSNMGQQGQAQETDQSAPVAQSHGQPQQGAGGGNASWTQQNWNANSPWQAHN